MRYGVCSFSGHAIPYGKGRIVVLPNGSSFLFARSKTRRDFLRGRNPRGVKWTISSRLSRKKGVIERVKKSRGTHVAKVVRSFVGMSLEELQQKIGESKYVAPEKSSKLSKVEERKREKIKKLAQHSK